MSYHSCSDSEPDTKPGAGAGAGAGQALVWRTVRVTIHCHSRGFSQVSQAKIRMSWCVM